MAPLNYIIRIIIKLNYEPMLNTLDKNFIELR